MATEGWTECSSVIADPSNTPHEPANAVRICRSGVLAISYDVDMINPAFSQYHITPAQAKNLLPGRLSFYEDPDLLAMGITQAAVNSDAFSDDWNRGHLAPNHIISFSNVSKKSCFSMANIAPQAGYFNQQPWNALEGKVADWVASNEELFIITGVAYRSREAPTRTSNNIAVPDYYWKVLCQPTSGEAVGFYGYNNLTTKTTIDFVPVTDIEEIYGGSLLPTSMCKTAAVNKNYWW
eukprot:GDKK01055877.1.p1 GENE.GDKK01055877.1~~GDKK01055877.1.p1  ORF type:complete len:250 (+),score=39.99 GDKK01055877.1:40-750(+)